MGKALEGIRIIEWGEWHAIPEAGATCADLGAEVIKIERRIIGEANRGQRTMAGLNVMTPSGKNYMFEQYNRGKKSITIDVTKPEGREIVYRLVGKSDVFMTNYREKAILKNQMDYNTLRRYNEKLIYISSTGYGKKGLYKDTPGFDGTGQAFSGLMSVALEKAGHVLVGDDLVLATKHVEAFIQEKSARQ